MSDQWKQQCAWCQVTDKRREWPDVTPAERQTSQSAGKPSVDALVTASTMLSAMLLLLLLLLMMMMLASLVRLRKMLSLTAPAPRPLQRRRWPSRWGRHGRDRNPLHLLRKFNLLNYKSKKKCLRITKRCSK